MTKMLSVLVADDEPLVRKKVGMMLAERFCVAQADSAASARSSAARGFDAILLDIVFPDGNGIEICREIKGHDPHTTVVISSSMESVDAWHEAFRAGADGYLEKREMLALDPRKITLMVENLVERNRLRRQAEEASQRQAELMSVLSHDVRAPFQALLGTIEILGKMAIPPDAAASVEMLNQCAKDQLAFINSLLEVLRLESGMVGLRLMALDINLPVQQSIHSLGVLAEHKKIKLESDLRQDFPMIQADVGRICQLVNNLVTNAIKFTPAGGIVKVSTRAAADETGEGVEICVEDTGIGVPPEQREKIFQRFHRGREKGTDGEGGTGLGLAICREIVQLHHGKLDLDENRTKGSAFRAWLPVEPSAIAGQTACDSGCGNARTKVTKGSPRTSCFESAKPEKRSASPRFRQPIPA